MLGIMFQKLWAKKWMFLCLLLGSVLLIATVISFPMYQNAAFDRLLRDGFRNSLTETGEWPATLKLVVISRKNDQEDRIGATEELFKSTGERLGLETKEMVEVCRLTQWKMHTLESRTDSDLEQVRLAYMSNLSEHVTMLSGEMYSESGVTPDGSIEVVISQECMVSARLLVGDALQFDSFRDAEGNPVRLKVVGVYKRNDNDFFWEIGDTEINNSCMMNEALFRERYIWGETKYNITARFCYLFEYESLNAMQIEAMMKEIQANEYQGDVCLRLLEEFQAKRARISVTLFILQVPVLVLLAAFLFMVSGQMYELEKNEISVIKSRGSSGFQIFRLYLYQSIFMAGTGVLLGFPLGHVFCRILGSSSNFLEFGLRRNLEVRYDARVWIYLAASALATVLILAIPAIGHSRVSIVHLKQKRARKKRPLWERFFLDFLCLGIGIYGYYNFARNQDTLVRSVLMEQPVDFLLYACSSLFIVGAGLLFLRLQPFLVQLVYWLGSRFWSPASYASFIEILKNGRKQHFIMLFLILTVSLGAFDATVARTILQNARNNVEYLDGADIIIRDVWKDNAAWAALQREAGDEDVKATYYEPDYQKYATLEAAQSYTKVLYDDLTEETSKMRTTIRRENTSIAVCLMGIHTKEFGEMTWLDRSLLADHYYNYLNALADEPNGILLSRNFQDLGCTEGTYITYTFNVTLGRGENVQSYSYEINSRIVGFVDYWPGFSPVAAATINVRGEVVEVENYLIVANMAALQNAFDAADAGVYPYEVWVDLKEDADSAEVARWINENDVKVEKYVDRQADVKDTVEDPMLQGTNGVLTMGFLVMILLCGVGYLIYWIMSIRSREMIFGVLRAFGMHKREVFRMLALEQIFSGLLSILAGIFIGRQASKMYVPMLQTAYAAANQALPMQLYTNPEDLLRLYGALGLVMAVCLIVLILIVFKMNIAKALKLGEE